MALHTKRSVFSGCCDDASSCVSNEAFHAHSAISGDLLIVNVTAQHSSSIDYEYIYSIEEHMFSYVNQQSLDILYVYY